MSTRKEKKTPPAEKLALYDKLLEPHAELERKGATMAYTSCNGHMFSFLTKEGEFSLRLPEKEREAFIKKFNATPSVQHGVTMKEYVVVPDEVLRNTRTLRKYFDTGYEYVKSLRPK